MNSSSNEADGMPNATPGTVPCEERQTHSFIVKIWLEETFEEAGEARWRGHITHVPSRERRYLKSLNDIALFILPYLESMKVPPGWSWRLWKWLCRTSN